MALTFDNSTNYLTHATDLGIGTEASVAGFARRTATGAHDTLACFSNDGASNQYCEGGARSTNNFRVVVRDGGTSQLEGGAFTTNTEFHCGYAWWSIDNDASMALYRNGAESSRSSASDPPSLNRFALGCLYASAISQYWKGEMWDWAAWNVQLTAAEFAYLATGISPLMVRPQNLLGYWPMHDTNNPGHDYLGQHNLTANGTFADYAPTAKWVINPTYRRKVWATFQPTAAGGADVQPTAGSLTLTGASPSVALLIAVAPSAASLTLTGASPTVSRAKNLDIGGTSLTLTGESPAIDRLYGLSPAAGTLTITGAQPSIALKRDITLTAASLALTGESPSVSKGIDRAITAGTITLTGESPSVALKRDITLTAGDLAITGATPGVALKRDASLAAATLTLTGESPAVAVTSGLDIQPTAAALALTGAQIGVALLIDLALTAESLSITGESPTVTVESATDIQPTAASLSLTGASPSIALRYNVAPVAGTMSITGAAISVTIPGVTPVAPSVPDGGGRGSRRRRRSVWRPRKVIIGGEVYVVRTPLELRELLEAHRRKLQAQLKATHTPKAQRSLKRQITVVRKKLETARADARTWVDDLQDDDEEILEIWMLLH